MNRKQEHEKLAHGATRWQAARLKPVVKRLGIKNTRKPKVKPKAKNKK